MFCKCIKKPPDYQGVLITMSEELADWSGDDYIGTYVDLEFGTLD